MKKILFITILLLFFNNIILQLNGQTAPKIEWEKTIGYNLNQKGNSILELKDHSFIIAATRSKNMFINTNLMQVDYQGNKINEQEFKYISDGTTKMIKSKDNNLIITGITYGADASTDMLIMKNDLNFNTKWKKNYGRKQAYTRNVVLCSDGGFLLVGISADSMMTEGKAFAVRLNSSGNLLWQKEYGRGNNFCNAAIQTKDKGFILVGAGYIDDTQAYTWIAKINSSGYLQWQKELTTEAGIANDIVATDDGNYLITGIVANTFIPKGGVIKINAAGKILWKKRYGGSKSDEMVRIIKNNENSYLIVGSTKSKGLDWDVWLTNIDKDGNVIWDANYGGRGSQKAFDVVKTFDGGFAVVGYTAMKRFKKDLLLMKLNFSMREKATEYVENKIITWQQKGKFEKLDDYKRRVNESSRQQKIYKLTNEFFEQIGKPIFDKELKTVTLDYDTENEVFRANLTYFNSIYIPVPIAEAPSFDKNFKNLSFSNIKYNLTSNDKLEIYQIKIYNRFNKKTYFFDASKPIIFNNEVIENKFSPIVITPIDNSETPDNQNNTQIDVDSDIPNSANTNNNRYALIIGNANYIEQGSDMVDIKYSINDAKTFKQYAIKVLGVPDDNNHIYYIENANATYIKLYIDNFSKLIQTKTEGEFYVYYSGHGTQNEKKESFIVPVGVTSDYINDFGIKLSDFYTQLNPGENKKVIVFLDACFSGGGKSGQLLINAKTGFKTVPKKNNLSANLLVFAASSEKQISQEFFAKKHGLFTYFLLKNLKETGGKITYGELANRIIDNVVTTALNPKNGLKNQTPTINVSPQTEKEWKLWSVIH